MHHRCRDPVWCVLGARLGKHKYERPERRYCEAPDPLLAKHGARVVRNAARRRAGEASLQLAVRADSEPSLLKVSSAHPYAIVTEQEQGVASPVIYFDTMCVGVMGIFK